MYVSLQICGVENILSAIDSGQNIKMILVDRDEDCEHLLERCRTEKIKVVEGSSNDLWRMSANGQQKALALIGREPEGTLDEVFDRDGAIWLFDGVEYAPNLGFGIRTAEVSGAKAVFVDGKLSHAEKKAARRASMKADRFMPVRWVDGFEIVERARAAGFRIISLEDSGGQEPWEEDLSGNVILVVGGEHDGISQPILDGSDSVIRVPMSGFVPSYNLQAPMAVVAAEALRQRNSSN